MKKNYPFGEMFYRSLKKTLLIMRIAVILMIFGILQANAKEVYSQNTKLSLNFSDAELVSVLDKIENESEFFFLYNEKLLDISRKVSITAEDQLINVILDDVFANTDVKYTIIDRKIILAPDYLTSEPQQKQITGTVTDKNGAPVIGANVVVTGTTLGTLTDVDGKYSIEVLQGSKSLTISFIGMETQEISIGTLTQINVTMAESAIGLEEVVVIGYGSVNKSDLTGSVLKINMAGKELVANVTLLQALQGNSPGLNIVGGVKAGGEPTISIRGKTSLSASDMPLVVLDGIIYNGSISDININDVESIEILKDASAAAVYGARSANGVMIISSKKGKTDKPLLTFNMYHGFQDFTNNPMKVMNANQYAERLVDYYYQQQLYIWYAELPTNETGKPVRADITDRNIVATFLRTQEEKDNYLAGNEIDWIKEVTRVAPIQNYDLSASGRTDRTNYFVSASYTDQKGVMLNDRFQRITLRTNFENKITDWFTLGLSSSYSFRDYSGMEASMNYARAASPLANMYNDQGIYPMYLVGEQYQQHPLGSLNVDDKDIRNNLFTIVSGKIEIPKIKGLTYNFNYSNTLNLVKHNIFYPATVFGGKANNGLATKAFSEEGSWIYNNILSYLRTFGTDHKVNATLLYSKEQRRGESSNLRAEGFQNPILGYNGMALGTIAGVKSGAWEENSLSFMARAIYTYKSRYLFTGTLRRDGYSGFGENRKFATFPSLSLGWIASKEAFLKNVKWLNYLKLRTSYGLNGNQGIGRYASFSKMSTTAYVYGSATYIGIYPSILGNVDLGWESTASFNIGLDYGFLKQRISGEIDVYKSKTSDVLVNRSVPSATGFDNLWTNIGGIENKGIELVLTTVNFDRPFRWETRFVFSLNRNKITALYGGKEDKDIGNSWFVGEPISSIYDYKATGGVWTEEELFNKQIPVTKFYPGHFRYEDLNKDGIIDPNNDRTIIGYKTPNYSFSINNTLSYKNFTLSFFLNSIQGGNGYYLANNSNSTIAADKDPDVTIRRNCNATRQYWAPDNGVNNSPGIYYAPPRKAGVYEDRSFVRLQDVTFLYRFNKNLLNTLGFDDFQFYVSGKNLYTWTNWSGWDPEIGDLNDFSVDEWSGAEQMMRSIIAGVKIGF